MQLSTYFVGIILLNAQQSIPFVNMFFKNKICWQLSISYFNTNSNYQDQ